MTNDRRELLQETAEDVVNLWPERPRPDLLLRGGHPRGHDVVRVDQVDGDARLEFVLERVELRDGLPQGTGGRFNGIWPENRS